MVSHPEGRIGFATLYFIRMDTVAGTAMLYCASLVCITPFSFGVTLNALSLNWKAVVRPVGVPMLACGAAFFAVYATRTWGGLGELNIVFSLLLFGAIFAVAYAVSVAILAFDIGRENVLFLRNAVRR